MKRISVLLVVFSMLFIGMLGISGDTLIARCKLVSDGFPTLGAGVLNETPPLPVLRCLYYDQQAFKESYDQVNSLAETKVITIIEDDSQPAESSMLQGGILPHHLVASPMIARFFATLKQEVFNRNTSMLYPETIILLAPNHKRVGDSLLHTGAFSWETPFGRLEADQEIVDDLIFSFHPGVSPKLLEDEHAISALIPYVNDAFPEAKIVPILIHGNMGREDCRALSEFLVQKALDKPCLILASIDFSHGLAPEEALKRDEMTQRIMEARDFDALFKLDNTYLDAPPTLATFLMTMDGLRAKTNRGVIKDPEQDVIKHAKGTLLEHSEASRFLKRRVIDTTSYMTWLFTGSQENGSHSALEK